MEQLNTDPKPQSKSEGLYGILINDPKYKDTLPDYPTFEKKLQTDRFAGQFYDILKQDPKYKSTLPEKDKFMQSLKVVKKKDPTQASSEEPGNGSTQAGSLKDQLDAGDFGPLSEKARQEILDQSLANNIVREGAPELTGDRLKEIQDRASGAPRSVTDQVSTTFSNYFTKSLPANSLRSLGAVFALGDEPTYEETSDFYKKLGTLKESNPDLYDKMLKDIPSAKPFMKELESIVSSSEDVDKRLKQFLDSKSTVTQEILEDAKAIEKTEDKEGLITDLSQVSLDDPVSIVAFAANSITQGVGQIGTAISTGGGSIALETLGSVYGEAVDDAVKAGRTMDEAVRDDTSLYASIAISGAVAFLEKTGISKLIGGAATKKATETLAKAVMKGFLIEGATESGQEIIQDLGTDVSSGANIKDLKDKVSNDKFWNRILTAGAAGGLTGGAVRGGINAASKARPSGPASVIDKVVEEKINEQINETQPETTNEASDAGSGDAELANVELEGQEQPDPVQADDKQIENTGEQVNPEVDKPVEEVNAKVDKKTRKGIKKPKKEEIIPKEVQNEETTDDRGAESDVVEDATEEPTGQDLNQQIDQEINEEGDNTSEPADEADPVRPGKTTKFIFHDGVGREGEIVEQSDDKVTLKDKKGYTYIVNKNQLVSEEESKAREEVSKKLPESADIIDQDLDKIIADTPKARVNEAKNTAKSIVNPLVPVFKALDTTQKAIGKIFKNPAKRTENMLAEKVNKGLKSQNYAVRNISGTLKNIAGGLAYTEGSAKNKREYNGLKSYANYRAQQVMKDMYKLVDDDIVALANVHAVLDPEAYQDTEYSGKAYKDLNEKEKKLHDVLRNTNNYIHDYHFGKGFIDLETYNKHKGKYIARLYEEFELQNTPDDMKEMLKRSKAEFDMFRQRKNFDEVGSSIMRDPVYATAKRVGQMIQNQAIMEYTQKIANSKDIKVSDTEFPGSTKLSHSGRWPVYGALTNKYVPNYIAEDFKGFFFANKSINSLYDFFRGYDKLKLRQILKKSHTVYNPLTRMGNIVSNFSFAFWANVDPVSYFANRTKAKKQIKEGGDKYVDLIKAGLIGTEIITGDLSPLAQKNEESTVINKIDNKIAEVFSGKNKISKGLRNLDNWFTTQYGKADDVAKMSAYITLMDDYGLSKDEAINQVYEGFQNYSSVGKLYDVAAKTPVIGNAYIKFKADLARIMKNTITKRPLTGMAYLGLLYWIKNVFSDASDEEDIIQEARERRPFIPKIKTPLGDIALVWQVPGVGEVNFARYITPYYMYDKGSSEDLVNLTTEWLPYQLEMVNTPVKNIKVPFPELPDVFLGTYAQVAIDRDFRGKSIRDPRGNQFKSIATPNEQIINAMTYIARSQVPMFASAQNFYAAYSGDTDYYGRERTVAQAILNNFIKVQDFGEEEVRKQLTNEIEYKVSLFESYQKDIAIVKKDTKDRITDIYSREKIGESKKEELAAKEIKAMEKRIADLLGKQVEIVKEIEEPSQLLQKVIK